MRERRRDGDGSGIDGLSVVNDKIVFSLYEGGVFTVPLGGGTVEPVEEGAGMHLLAWPWAGTPGRGGEPAGAWFAQIKNVETGETRTAVTHPGEVLRSCGLTMCAGATPEGTTFSRQRDGSSQRNVPQGHVSTMIPPAQGRLHVSVYGDHEKPLGVGLYDLETGKSGSLGIEGGQLHPVAVRGVDGQVPQLHGRGRALRDRPGEDPVAHTATRRCVRRRSYR